MFQKHVNKTFSQKQKTRSHDTSQSGHLVRECLSAHLTAFVFWHDGGFAAVSNLPTTAELNNANMYSLQHRKKKSGTVWFYRCVFEYKLWHRELSGVIGLLSSVCWMPTPSNHNIMTGRLLSWSRYRYLKWLKWAVQFTKFLWNEKLSRADSLSRSVLDLENAPLLQIVHLFENQSHVVTELLELGHGHLDKKTTINSQCSMKTTA